MIFNNCNPYINKESRLLDSIKHRPPIIFDIGANNGSFTDACLTKYPHSAIIAIEPNDNLTNQLKNKFINNLNVSILNYIISNKSGIDIDFYIGDTDTVSTASRDWMKQSRFSNTNKWSDPIKKESLTIDDLIIRFGKPDLIKIDVEGYELEVIQGLSTKQNIICFEWCEEFFNKAESICQYLNGLGYSNFGFTYGDTPLNFPSKYTLWELCDIHKNIDQNRKSLWGMIYVY